MSKSKKPTQDWMGNNVEAETDHDRQKALQPVVV